MRFERDIDPLGEVTQRWLVQFGDHLRCLRLERNLTQEGLAELSGLHRVVIGKLERAERDVGISHIYRLATALEVTPSELLDF